MTFRAIAHARCDLVISLVFISMSLSLCAYLYDGILDSTAIVDGLHDSVRVYGLGEAIWQGERPQGSRLAIRGYLYPTLAVGLFRISPIILLLVQTAAVGLGVWFLLKVERKLHGRIWCTPIAAFSISLLLSPAHMMTEALAFCLSAGALAVIVGSSNRVWGVAILWIAALIKASFLPVAVLSAILGLQRSKASFWVLVLVAGLLAPQLISTHIINGKAAISIAGAINIQNRFYPAVVGMVEKKTFVDYRTDFAEEARQARPEMMQKVSYMLNHPLGTLKTWHLILWEHHLNQNSGFVQRDNKVATETRRDDLRDLSIYLNQIIVWFLLPGGLGVATYMIRNSIRVWPAALIGPSLILSAPLVYHQGDRGVFIGLLLILPFAGLGMSEFVRLLNIRRAD